MKEEIKTELSSIVKIFFLCILIFSVLITVDFFNDKQENSLIKESIQLVFDSYNKNNNTSFSVESLIESSTKTKFWAGKEFSVSNSKNEKFLGFCFPENSVWGPVLTVSVVPDNATSSSDVIYCGIAGVQSSNDLSEKKIKTDINQVSFDLMSNKAWLAWSEKNASKAN